MIWKGKRKAGAFSSGRVAEDIRGEATVSTGEEAGGAKALQDDGLGRVSLVSKVCGSWEKMGTKC